MSIPSEIPHTMLHDFILKSPARNASSCSMLNASNGERAWSGELQGLTSSFASWLRAKGVAKGDTIMLLMHNCVEYPIALLACMSIGAVPTMANPDVSPVSTLAQIAKSKAKLVLLQSSATAAAEALRIGLPIPNISDLRALPQAAAGEGRLAADDQQVALLPFSSGTTGFPKGVMLSHKNIVSSVSQLVCEADAPFELTENDNVLCLSPMYHVGALSCAVFPALRAGACVVFAPFNGLADLISLCEHHKITVLPIMPAIAELLLRSRKALPAGVRLSLTGGATLRPETELALRARLPRTTVFGQVYGMTEASGPVSFPSPLTGASIILPKTRVRIVDSESGCVLQQLEKPGEIQIAGETVMLGYLDAAVQPFVDGSWLPTGDLGILSDDRQLRIVDRLKDVFKSKSGFQVSPSELEGIIKSHPAVADAAVIGKKESYHEVPVAFVVKKDEVTPQEIMNFVADKVLVQYKRIKAVHFLDEIPRNATGKIARKDLMSLL